MKRVKNKVHTWYVVSDIHSFATELKLALKSAGFDRNDPTKGLIVLGDIFDRGNETIEVYKYLSTLPKYRCILIRGNHEHLFAALLKKSCFESHDLSNHTVDTFCHIAHRDINDLHCGDVSWKEITDFVKSSKIWAWLNSKQWVNYFELGPYIFTHSFIPVRIQEKYKQALSSYSPYDLSGKAFEYREDWRNATNYEWEDATWGDPVDYYKAGLFEEESKKGKILVVGHWHVSDFWKRIANIKSYDQPITDIYYSQDFIGLDCGVFREPMGDYYHPQNVLVIDDKDFNKCYDQYGVELKDETSIPRIETITKQD